MVTHVQWTIHCSPSSAGKCDGLQRRERTLAEIYGSSPWAPCSEALFSSRAFRRSWGTARCAARVCRIAAASLECSFFFFVCEYVWFSATRTSQNIYPAFEKRAPWFRSMNFEVGTETLGTRHCVITILSCLTVCFHLLQRVNPF